MSLATAVKFSEDDAAWLYPGLTPAETANRVIGLGPNLVVTTLGGAGSLVVGPTFELSVPVVRPARVIDTIGAGDTYMAAMISFLLKRPSASMDVLDARAMAEFSGRAAAITVARRGADLPRLADLDSSPTVRLV